MEKYLSRPAIVREGFVQRFEITFDLAWKTAKDFMEFEGLHIQPTPRTIIKEAFAANIITDGQAFIDMLEARNLMSYRYDEETFNVIFLKIKKDFYPALEKFRVKLGRKANEAGTFGKTFSIDRRNAETD